MFSSTTHSVFRLVSNPRTLARMVPLGASFFAITLAGCGGTNQSPAAEVPTPAPTVEVAAPRPAIAPTLQAKLDAFASQVVTLRAAEKEWQQQAAELGATASVEGDTLRVAVDENKLRDYLNQIAPDVALPAQDAALATNNGALNVTPSSEGRALDADGAVAAVTAALQQNSATPVTLPTATVAPAVTTAAAESAITQAEALLLQPFELTVGKKNYTWDAETLAPLLAFKPTGNGSIGLTADRAKLTEQVTKLADRSQIPAREPMVDWNGGNLRIRAPGKPGARLDQARAVDAIAAAIEQNAGKVTLATTALAPRVTSANLDTLGIKEVVSTGKSDFTGSADYRITNISVGMKLLNGVLIAPGEEFSFNNTVGEINAANGFVEGYAIINNRTQIEFGGGICQDSTTVFRAAFWAGLPITDRKEHSYYINWYDKYGLGPNGNGPGLDAAIFTGVQDLRFVNDTGNWLLMQATADPKTALAQVTLYGTKLNREVSITQKIVKRTPAIAQPEYIADPKQPRGAMKRTDTARGGMKIEVYRTVTTNGVKTTPELFATSFKPWPNKYAVNPADMGENGIPVFLQPTATLTPTVDPALQPTVDPNAPPAPTVDLNGPIPTVDPNAPVLPVDPNTQPTPTVDPASVPPANPVEQQPTPDPNAAATSG